MCLVEPRSIADPLPVVSGTPKGFQIAASDASSPALV